MLNPTIYYFHRRKVEIGLEEERADSGSEIFSAGAKIRRGQRSWLIITYRYIFIQPMLLDRYLTTK